MQEKSCTVGKFESFHRGHQKLIKEVKKFKNPEILSIQFPENYPLFTLNERKYLARRFNINLISIPFNDIKSLTPEEFFSFLKEHKYTTIVVGSDWKFGKDRTGNIETAKKLGEKYGIKVIEIQPLKHNGRKISTSWIKELLKKGGIEKANFLLGFPFFTTGKITKGKGIGRKIGFPTINIKPFKKLPIPYGVYKVYLNLNGKELVGAANFGVRPTVCGKEELLEIHVIDKLPEIEIQNTEVKVEFLKFLRNEQKFNSLEELKKQIKLDVEKIIEEDGGNFERNQL